MISPLAYVDAGAKLGKNVTVHPFAYIDKNVEIGDNCEIMPYASVLSGTRMGANNRVFQHAVLGAEPQDFKYKGGDTLLLIGDNNVFRENVVVNRATTPEGKTQIGNGNFLHEGVHVSHDTVISNGCVLGYGSKISGNCFLEDFVIFGGNILVSQGSRVGTWSMVQTGCRSVAISRRISLLPRNRHPSTASMPIFWSTKGSTKKSSSISAMLTVLFTRATPACSIRCS